MSDASVRIVFSGDAAGAQRAVRGLEGSFLSLGKVAKAALAVGAGVVLTRALREAGKAAISFDQSMRNVNSLAKLSDAQLASLSKRVLALAGPTAQAPKTLADGLYDIVSSGFEANDAVKILAVSAKAATAGMSDTATATKAVVAVLNAYNLGADDARHVSDVLFQTVNKGVLTFEELASSVGDVLPFAAQLGVNIADVGGAMATMTLQGLSAAESATRLKGLLVTMIKPGDELAGTIKQLGFESGEAMLKQKGLVETVRLLDQAANHNKETLGTWFPNIRALGGFLALSGDQMERFTAVTQSMDRASQGAGATARAFAEQSKSLAFQWDRAKASLTAAAIPIAQLLFPALVRGAEMVADFARKVSSLGPQIKAGFAGFVDPVKAAVEGLFGIFQRVGDAIKDFLDFGGTGAGSKLADLFKDAETAGRTLGTGLVVLVGGFAAYRAAVAGATAATKIFEAVTTKSVVGLLLKAGVFIGGAVASWFGLQSAIDSANAAAERTAPAWERARQAVEGMNQSLATVAPAQVQLRDATLQVEQAQLNVTQALANRAQVEETAGKNSLAYAQAQLAVKQAYAALDNAERQRTQTLDQVRQGTQAAREANRAFIGTLMETIRATGETSAAQQRQFIQLGGFRNHMLSFADAARDGTDRMRRFTAATFALGQQLGRMPTRVEVETALDDKQFRPALLRALRDLDLLSAKDVKTTVDIKILAKDALKEVNKQLDEAKGKNANPKVIIELKQAKTQLEKLLDDLTSADKKKARPKLEVLKGQFFQILDRAETAISNLDKDKAQPKIEIDPYPALSAISKVKSALGGLQNVSRTITYTYRTVGSPPRGRAGGGFIPGPDTGGRDSVLTYLAPGEVVLNRSQQAAFGGPGVFKRMFGFDTTGVPGMAGGGFVQSLASGGFVSAGQAGKALAAIIKRDKKNSGYKAQSKAVTRLAHALDANRTEQDNLARSISQDIREADISVEEFIKVDADGNETLDTGAVQQRVGEINQLLGRYQQLLGLVDEETAILKQLIEALEAAIKAWQAEIRDQERVIRETTALIQDATKKMNAATDQGVKNSYQQVISRAERTRDNARSKIQELRGEISTGREDRAGYRKDRDAQQYDSRDVELDVKELEQERTDVLAIRPRPPEPTSSVAESEATAAGAEGFSSGGTGGTEDQDKLAALEALNAELRRMVGQLKLALGLQNVQSPVIAAFQRGTLHVPQTGPYMLHGGERVVPAGFRQTSHDTAAGGDIRVIINVASGMEWLKRFIDVRVDRGAGRVSDLLGREADRRFRAGESGALAAPFRTL